MSLVIPDEIFKRVLKSMGYPIVRIEDLSNGLMTEQEFKDVVLFDALHEYFSWFPIEDKQEYSVTTTFDIDFPSEDVYDVVDYRLVTYGNSYAGRTGSPFLDAVQINSGSSSFAGRGMYGTPYNYGMNIAYSYERMARQSVIDRNRVVQAKINYRDRKITGYTNVSGKLNITWAKTSEDFSDVLYQHQTDVIELMKAETFLYFGNLRNQIAGTTDADLDGSDLVSQGTEMKTAVLEKFKSKPKIVVMR